MLQRRLVSFLAVPGTQHGVLLDAALACGAGVYEEILFRLLVLSAIYYVVRQATGTGAAHQVAAGIVAVVVSALLFSAFHHWPGGEPLSGVPSSFVLSPGVLSAPCSWRAASESPCTPTPPTICSSPSGIDPFSIDPRDARNPSVTLFRNPPSAVRSTALHLENIKFSHSIFALPFALAGRDSRRETSIPARGLPRGVP